MICSYCDLTINNPHGNRKYHPECSRKKKRERSKRRYYKMAIASDPLWNSERLLRNTYQEDNPYKTYDLNELISEGLDIECYQSKKTTKEKTIWIYKKHGFYFLTTKRIIICKI